LPKLAILRFADYYARMSEATTRGVRVRVESVYLPDRSSPTDHYYFFAYHVEIANQSSKIVQLLSRSWIIVDSDGQEQRVEGPGVIGEQPVLAPGESFDYTSFCPLRTESGSMHGTYSMIVADSRETFEAEIAPFELAVPHVVN